VILGVYGTGGAGRELFELIETWNKCRSINYDLVFIDDYRDSEKLFDVDIFSFDSFRHQFSVDEAKVVVSAGEPRIRKLLWERVKANGYGFETLIHPQATVSPRATIGEGSIIKKGALVSCDCIIGKNVDIMVNSYIGHDSSIGDHGEIGSLVSIGGYCSLGEEVFIGQGTIIRDKISIGNKSIIGMGSIVTCSFDEKSIVYGNPAKLIRTSEDGAVF